MLEGLKYPTSDGTLSQYLGWRIITFFFKIVYIFLVNLRFLGKPSKDILSFVVEAHKDAYHSEMSFFEKLFYSLYGKDLIQIVECGGLKVGFGLYRIDPIWHIHGYKFGIIHQYRGKGLAKPFNLKVFKFYKIKGFKLFTMYSTKDNAMKIYLDIGFIPTTTRGEMIKMVKKL